MGFNSGPTHTKHDCGHIFRDSTGNRLDDLMAADSFGSLQPLPSNPGHAPGSVVDLPEPRLNFLAPCLEEGVSIREQGEDEMAGSRPGKGLHLLEPVFSATQ